MGGTQTLTPESWSDAAAVRQACPRCDEPWDDAQPVVTSHFADRPLRCCRRCGCHFTAGESPFRLIRTCDRCSLPFLTDDPIVNDEPRCPDCCSGRTPSDLLDPSVTSATEAEVRLALQEQWSFVTSESLSTYLGAVTRQLAREVRGAAESARVELINDADVKTLALPSGVLLISLGMLASLEDEAELAFVIAHELAHSSGDAAIRLVRLGLQAVAREQESTGRRIWARAANDLVALGYGRRREREADAKALKALLGLDYDPRSAARYLERLESRIAEGDPRIRAHAFAHPPPRDRWRQIESAVCADARSTTALRVNRELFRRAAGPSVLSGRLVPVKEIGGAPEATGSERPTLSARTVIWAGLGIVLFLILLVVLVLALSS
jgi:hypothetical protein